MFNILATFPGHSLSISSWQHQGAQSQFGITVSSSGKNYMIHVNDKVWLNSGNTHFTVNGQSYDTKTGSLKLENVSHESGRDQVGNWQSTSFHYIAGSTRIRSAIKMYNEIAAIVFIQVCTLCLLWTSKNKFV